MIRAVFFDLDGTLYDRDAAIVRLAEMQFEKFGAQLPHLTQSTFVGLWSPRGRRCAVIRMTAVLGDLHLTDSATASPSNSSI